MAEIRKGAEHSDRRIKPVVKTMISSGVRIGAGKTRLPEVIGQTFDLRNKSKELVLSLVNNNSDVGIGFGIGLSFMFSPNSPFFVENEGYKNQVIYIAMDISSVSWGFGYGFKLQLSSLNNEIKVWIDQFAVDNKSFANGFNSDDTLGI